MFLGRSGFLCLTQRRFALQQGHFNEEKQQGEGDETEPQGLSSFEDFHLFNQVFYI